MSARRTVARALVGLVSAGVVVGPLTADVLLPATARQHMANPRWPDHAKFHNAQYVVMSAVLGAVGLRLVTSPTGDTDRNLLTAAVIASTPFVGMWGAMAFPGTALVDEEFADLPHNRILGVESNIFIGTACLALLAVAHHIGREPGRDPESRV